MKAELINALLRSVADKPDVVLVGGQAIAIWANHFLQAAEFQMAESVVTTKDVDFLGSSKRAEEIARQTNARIAVPSIENSTPNSAVLDLGSSNEEDASRLSGLCSGPW